MTTVAAINGPGGTWIGSDTATELGGLRHHHAEKIVQRWFGTKRLLVGYAGDSIMVRAIRECGTAETVAELADAMWSWLKARDALDNGMMPGCAVAATQGSVWLIDSRGCASKRDYVTIGSGQSEAAGAMFAAVQLGQTAKRCVELALDAALHHDPSTGGKPDIRRVQ